MSHFAGLRIALVGPLPVVNGDGLLAGGMANQTRQLANLLQREHAVVELVQTNALIWPAALAGLRVVRAAFRLLPYLFALWRAAGRNDVFHVMANSGWAWHLFAAPAIWIAGVRRVPAVVNYRGGQAQVFLARSPALLRCTVRRSAALVVPSGFLQAIFERHGITAQVVPNVVDLAFFRPRDASVAAGAHLVVTRHLEPIYDNATALRAFALVLRQRPDARLSIAGSGPDEPRLRALAVELGVRDAVAFEGGLDRDAIAALYRDADICINPSLADNAPNSLLEAMASGVAVVSTDVGGVPFLVEHDKTALLVAPQDADAMAREVLHLLGDAVLRERLVRNALQLVQRHTWVQVAPRLAAVYREALATAAATARA